MNRPTHKRPKPTRSRGVRRAVKKSPAYEPDDGPLTAKQIGAIKKLVGAGLRHGGSIVVVSSLFPDESTQASRRKRRGSRGAKMGGKG